MEKYLDLEKRMKDLTVEFEKINKAMEEVLKLNKEFGKKIDSALKRVEEYKNVKVPIKSLGYEIVIFENHYKIINNVSEHLIDKVTLERVTVDYQYISECENEYEVHKDNLIFYLDKVTLERRGLQTE